MPCRCSWHFLTHLSPVNLFITSLFMISLFITSLSYISQFTAVCLCHWHNWTFRHFWSQSFHFLAEICYVLNSVTLWMLLLWCVKLLDSLVFFSQWTCCASAWNLACSDGNHIWFISSVDSLLATCSSHVSSVDNFTADVLYIHDFVVFVANL